MRFDPGKAWPHPVLRPPSYGDDYLHAEFEVEIEVERAQGSTSIEITAEFELSDPDLLQLVDDGAAKYVLLIKASRTHFREMISSGEPHLKGRFPGGDLSGLVEFVPFLVCTGELQNFRAEGWHQDFLGRTFDISSGSVLAEDVSKDYWVDTADEAPLGSIFEHRPNPKLPDGRWELELTGDRVSIVMSESDTQKYTEARNRANNRPEGQYLMNGLYLPALIAVLNEADRNLDDYSEYRWFASLDHRLAVVECRRLGDVNANRWSRCPKNPRHAVHQDAHDCGGRSRRLMTSLRYFTTEVLEDLRVKIAKRLDWYYAPEGPPPGIALVGGVRESRLAAPALAEQLVIDAVRPSSTDAENALFVYQALSDLTSHQASIERMWVYLCHCDCSQYVTARWLGRRPEKDEEAVRQVRNHFFAAGNRAFLRDNAVSRLWWLGKIAHDVDAENPREFLKILLHRQDVRSALIERPSVSTNRRVLRGIYEVMQEHWSDGGALFARGAFRAWMIALNRRGGVVLLDALPEQALGRLLREEARFAIEEHST